MLNESEKIGIGLRPRQTMFKNLLLARHNFVDIINHIFSTRDISTNTDVDSSYWKNIFTTEDKPSVDVDFTFPTHISLTRIKDKDFIEKNILVEHDEEYNNIWTVWKVKSLTEFELIDYQKWDMGKFWTYKDVYKDTATYLSIPKRTITSEMMLNEIKSTLKQVI